MIQSYNLRMGEEKVAGGVLVEDLEEPIDLSTYAYYGFKKESNGFYVYDETLNKDSKDTATAELGQPYIDNPVYLKRETYINALNNAIKNNKEYYMGDVWFYNYHQTPGGDSPDTNLGFDPVYKGYMSVQYSQRPNNICDVWCQVDGRLRYKWDS